MYGEVYGMRDTYATLNLNDLAPLDWISEQMGREEVDTTRKHYARRGANASYTILDRLDEARRGQKGPGRGHRGRASNA